MPGADIPTVSPASPSSPAVQAEECAPSAANGSVVAALVRELSVRERLVVCLRYCDGLTTAEIAAVLGDGAADIERLLGAIAERARATITLMGGSMGASTAEPA